jgi:aryl-alcohol dehydrogenase-like predicted oxidoreductase
MKQNCIFETADRCHMSGTVLGTAGYGSKNDDRFYFEMLDYYISAGGNTLDTAAVYGESERTIGRWLKSRGINRSGIYISTKGAHPPVGNMQRSRMTAEDIRHDIENSLRDLGCGYIDIYFLHRDDINVPVSYIIDELNRYVKNGDVRALGASNWTYDRIRQANEYAASRNLCGFTFSQIYHSLARLTPAEYGDNTLVTMNSTEEAGYAADNITVMAYSPQARGFFYKNFNQPDDKIIGRFATAENRARLIRLRKLCEAKNADPVKIVLSYLTSKANRFVILPVIGASSLAQLRETMNSCGYELTGNEIDFLDGLCDNF